MMDDKEKVRRLRAAIFGMMDMEDDGDVDRLHSMIETLECFAPPDIKDSTVEALIALIDTTSDPQP